MTGTTSLLFLFYFILYLEKMTSDGLRGLWKILALENTWHAIVFLIYLFDLTCHNLSYITHLGYAMVGRVFTQLTRIQMGSLKNEP